MTSLAAATLYTGLFLFLFAILKLNCGRVRIGTKVNYGPGGNEKMIQAMRVQGNAIEDGPIVLIGLFGLASLSAPTLLIHVIGSVFFVSRVLHAIGLGSGDGSGAPRIIGTIGSLLSLLVTGGSCLWFVLS